MSMTPEVKDLGDGWYYLRIGQAGTRTSAGDIESLAIALVQATPGEACAVEDGCVHFNGFWLSRADAISTALAMLRAAKEAK